MDLHNKLSRVMEQREAEKEQAELRYAEASKKRLLKILQKKLSTSFIGSLAKFETYFGELWGHGLDDDECTNEQLAWRDLWEQCRTEVLNNGNAQVRAVETELIQYTTVWNRYRLTAEKKED